MSLMIYNSAGEKVKTLRSRTFQASRYVTLEWDGTNDQGGAVAGGVYLIRFEGDRHTQSRLLLVLR
jgi:flagellar hook assembly protein FlgD